MIRVSAHLYRLSDDRFARKLDGAWFETNAAGETLTGPHTNVLDIRYGVSVRAVARARRATLRDRIRTTQHGGGMLVEILDPRGELRRHTGTVRKVHPDYGPFRWHAVGQSGDAPLYIAAVLAAAHIIDESEPTL
jgi:hypothetical protein